MLTQMPLFSLLVFFLQLVSEQNLWKESDTDSLQADVIPAYHLTNMLTHILCTIMQ